MDAFLKKLEKVLKKELDVYEDILSLSKDKTDCLVEGNVKRLENIVKSEQLLVLEIGKLEEQRFETVQKISKKLDVDAEDITLTQLLDKVQSANKQNLEKLQHKITLIMEELQKINEMNTKLIQKSLQHINHSINIITSVVEEDTGIYKDGDKKGKKDVKSFMDIKL